jgi:hypothetical protein
MKKFLRIFIISVICISSGALSTGCGEWLDVVPEGVATLDNAFSNRINAEKMLFSCYNMLPDQNNPFTYPGNVGGDEIWWDTDASALNSRSGARIARNDQNATDPFQNYWDGRRDGKNLWIGIRDCNILINNISKVPDMQEYEKARWAAEATFIKAYLHFFLMQIYGPIPIVDENLSVEASPEEVRVHRRPVEEVTEYILSTIDKSMENLPDVIEESSTERGRVTKAIALAVKAKVLVWAASPLMNGNPDYANFKDKDGTPLVPQAADNSKWQRAADAIKEAIDFCHANGFGLYHYQKGFEVMHDETLKKYTIRGAVEERPMNNPEVIWSHTGGNNDQFQNYCTPKFFSNYAGTSELSAPLKIAEMFYTNNGVPIDEDKTWDYNDRYNTKMNNDSSHIYYIGKGETTAKLNYYREPRFYADLGFDRGIWEALAQKESQSIVIKNHSGEDNGVVFADCHIVTGYFIKKLVSFRSGTTTTSPSPYKFSIPIIRLADLYLLYAEALNEVKDAPDQEVYQWVDSIRFRAGLRGVVESWRDFSNMPSKPTTKEGMRSIIKQERLIELCFEGQRFFDLRRWKDALTYLNQPIQGWDYQGTTTQEYYNVVTYFNTRNYTYKDYLTPIYSSALTMNPNLVQNPGW